MPDAACGPGAHVDPITSGWGEVTPVQGGPLKVYDVKVGTTTVQMKLNEAEAKKRGVWEEPVPAPAAAKAKAPPRRSTAKNKKATIEDSASGGE